MHAVIPLWLRCVLGGGLQFFIMLGFMYLPTHIDRRLAKLSATIVTMPFTGVIISTMLLLDMHENFAAKHLVQAFHTVLWMCPTNVLSAWLQCEIAAQLNFGRVTTYVCATLAATLVWVWLAVVTFVGVMYTTEHTANLGYNHAITASLFALGYVASILLTKMPVAEIGNVRTSDYGRPKWMLFGIPALGGVMVVLITLVGAGSANGSYVLVGIMASFPLTIMICFTYLWFPPLPPDAPASRAFTENHRRAIRCRSLIWYALYGFRSYDIYYGILPSLLLWFTWAYFGWAVAVAFVLTAGFMVFTTLGLESCTGHAPSPEYHRLPVAPRAASVSLHL
jgi:hypothetical protein